jgi:hypothetical protein
VRSFKDIPATCPCSWVMEIKGKRVSGWVVTRALPGCLHHKKQTAGARAA